MDIKTRPQMDKPKVKNLDFVPKEVGNIWKHHHEQQEAQRGPKERSSVQYATEQVETAGKHGSLAAADGGRRAIRSLKQKERQANQQDRMPEQPKPPTEPKKNSLSQPQEQTSYPSAKRDGIRQAVEQKRLQQFQSKSVDEQFRIDTEVKGHSSFDVPRPQISQQNVAQPQQTKQMQVELGRQKAVQDTIKSRTVAEKILPNVEHPLHEGAKVDLPHIKTRQRHAGTAGLRQRRIKTAGTAEPVKKSGSKATQMARQMANNHMRRKMVQQSAEVTQREVRRIAEWTAAAAKAILHTAKAAVNSLAAAIGGGSVVLVMLVLLILVGAIAASPFGILFSNESSSADTVPISAAIAEATYDFNATLEGLQSADTYDGVTVEGEMADWVDVLVIFAVKTAGSDDVDSTDVVTMDADRVNRLKTVFADMNTISSTVETIDHPDSDPDDDTDDSWTEKTLHITITAKTAADMEAEYHFNTQQHTAVEELLSQRELIAELIGNLTAISADATEVLRNLPEELAPERREVIKTACSLVGKVNYFWGGKSLVMGWDSRWGSLRKVTADGSSTTGTYRPYGLDCSGFADWVFYNASGGTYVLGHGGGAMMQHSYCTSITWTDAIPGDLVFYPEDTHVGIVAGRDESGNLLIIHCASGYNNVVITGLEGFISTGSPSYYTEQTALEATPLMSETLQNIS